MYTNHYRRAITPIVIVVLIALFGASSGCLWAPDLAMVRRDIERQLPGVSFDKEIELTLGPISLAFARLITRMAPDTEDVSSYLRDVSRIELAVYNTKHMPPAKTVIMPERLQKMTDSEGWELAVKVRNDDELAWVLYRLEDETIKELYVVVVTEDELVMVKAEGKLERLVARALSDSGALKNIPDSRRSS
jgi:hypothetical protein